MDVIAQLEAKFDELVTRAKELEEENKTLRLQLEQESTGRRETAERIERLLNKVRENMG